MPNLKKIIAIFLFSFCCFLPLEAEAALVAKQLRYSNTQEKTRIVVDLSEEIQLETTTGFANRIEVLLGAGTIAKEVKDIVLSDPYVRQAKIFQINQGHVLLDILLTEELEYRVFLLKQPWRLVIDISKEYALQEEVEVAPGLKLTQLKQAQAGRKLRAYYLTIDKERWQIKPIIAKNKILSRDKLLNMAAASEAVAAVNASYFGPDGWIIGNLKIDDELVGLETQLRSAFLVYPNNKMEFTLLNYAGEVILPGGLSLPIKGVNRTRLTNDLVLYGSKFAPTTKTNEHGCDVLIDQEGTVLRVNPLGNTAIGPNQLVISGHGLMADHLYSLREGDRITLTQTLGEKGDQAEHVLGAGPRLLDNRRVVTHTNPEGFPADIMRGRAPRTAVALDELGNIILYVADGRSAESNGLTLTELAYELLALGAIDAMNLDGGGSSELVLHNQIINNPSEKEERRISAALAVFPR